MTEKPMTYAATGVDYDAMDPFKRMAQKAASKTAYALHGHDLQEVEWSRGESAYLMRIGQGYLAHVEEGLGTKNLVADAMYKLTGKSYYDAIAQDTVAMIVNDMVTLGVMPITCAMHLAVASSDWFEDAKRSEDLVAGWARACEIAGCSWGGGETPTLKGVVVPGTVVLSGSAVGKTNRGVMSPEGIKEGNAIVLIESSGIHANGLTLARTIAEKLPDGYLTKLSDGRTYGEALLDPTYIYARLVGGCLETGVSLAYAVNITGHGWRKLMRATQPFVYVIDKIPEPHPVFRFMQEQGPVTDEEAYGNLNMGAGFAIFCDDGWVPDVIRMAETYRFKAWRAGRIEKRGDEKKVIIKPKGLVYDGSTLGVR